MVCEPITPRFRRWFLGIPDGAALEMGTYVHAGDVARAYAAAIEKDLDGWTVYHLSAEDIALPRPLATVLRERLPAYPPLPENWPDYKSPVDTTRARRELGWSPQWSIREAYRAMTGKSLEEAAQAESREAEK